MKSKLDKEEIIYVFVSLYTIAIVYEIFLHKTGIEYYLGHYFQNLMLANFLFWALVTSIVVAGVLFSCLSYFFLTAAFIYFVVFRIYLTTSSAPENVYMPWNHALTFWIFLALGFRKQLSDFRLIQLIKFYLFFSYFAGGVAKARHGFEWMNGWTMQYYILDRHLLIDTPLAWELFKNLTRAQILSWSVVVAELSIPLLLFFRKLEWPYVIALLSFQIVCWYTMKLYWMRFYGWSYLIYLAIIVVYLFEWIMKRSGINAYN